MKNTFFILAFLGFQSLFAQNFKVPAYEKFQLKNGLTVYLMEQKEVPLLYVSMVFEAGSIKDTDRYGLASLTADGLLFGTKKFKKADIEEKLDFVGAELNTSLGKESAQISGACSKKDQDMFFEILQEVLTQPTFETAEFEKHKTRILAQLKQQKESPRSVIGSYYNALIFDKHPYATPTTGTESTVAKITVEDVRKFYQTEYSPKKAAIAITGDFSAKDMKKKIAQIFENWKPANSPSNPNLGKPELNFAKNRVLLIDKADARETTFWIGGAGVPQSNPDYVAIQVINTVLGGRFTSWLNDALRVNSGLTYGANSRFSRYKAAGTFQISTFTKNSTTVEAIDMALQVYDSLHKNGIDEATLNSAKNYVKGNFPPNYETARSMANLLTDMYLYGFTETYINDFQKNVDQLTTAKAKEMISKYFPRNGLQFVLIGKSAEIKEKVKKYGEITEKQIKADGF